MNEEAERLEKELQKMRPQNRFGERGPDQEQLGKVKSELDRVRKELKQLREQMEKMSERQNKSEK